MDLKYPVYAPYIKGNEKKYVNECLDSTWISSKGKFISLFEQKYAKYIGINYASTVCNGTAALHLALLALGIKPGDEIITPTFTYVATANAILYVGATPVFADSLKNTWQIDPSDIKRKITLKTKAVLVVHLYGHPCNMDAIKELCVSNHLFLIEDCAEAIGSLYKDRHVGTFGDISAFSFFGNKTITTGEGGMVVSESHALIDKVNYLKNHGMGQKQYWHEELGYNYRMTNICAAIGLAQMECIDEIIQRKVHIANEYRRLFSNTAIQFHGEDKDVFHTYWMCSILIPNANHRDELRRFLSEHGIDSRPLFYPIHSMPMYANYAQDNFPVAIDLSARGINLPSYPELTDEDISFISGKVIEFVNRYQIN